MIHVPLVSKFSNDQKLFGIGFKTINSWSHKIKGIVIVYNVENWQSLIEVNYDFPVRDLCFSINNEKLFFYCE